MIKTNIIALALLVVLVGAGCTSDKAAEGVGAFDTFWTERVQPKITDWYKKQQDSAINAFGENAKNLSKGLTEDQKKQIEEWLQANKLNDYGDPTDTVYTGGTPLFDEAKGVSLDRYEYLFEKFPSLTDIINQAVQQNINQ